MFTYTDPYTQTHTGICTETHTNTGTHTDTYTQKYTHFKVREKFYLFFKFYFCRCVNRDPCKIKIIQSRNIHRVIGLPDSFWNLLISKKAVLFE